MFLRPPPLVHTTAEKIKTAALLIQFGLPVHKIRYQSRAFRKLSSNQRNLKTPALRFRVDGNILQTELFENDDIKVSSNTIKSTGQDS